MTSRKPPSRDPYAAMYAATVRGTGSVPLESHHANEVVELNVGGTLYTTRYHTLVGTNSAFFGTMFRIDRSGRVAINPYNVAVCHMDMPRVFKNYFRGMLRGASSSTDAESCSGTCCSSCATVATQCCPTMRPC